MHVISKRPFNKAKKDFPNCASAIDNTYKVLSNVQPKNPDDLKDVFPSLDNFKYKDKWYVIDIGGNHLRLIAFIEFVGQKVFIKHIVDHKEYDKITDRYRKQPD